jgi:hypothetical protein
MTNLIILLNGIVVGMLVYKTDRLRHEVNNLAKSQLQLVDVLQRLINRIGRKES